MKVTFGGIILNRVSQRVPGEDRVPAAFRGDLTITARPIACPPFSFPHSFPLLPGITSPVNYLHPSPRLRLYFGGPTKTGTQRGAWCFVSTRQAVLASCLTVIPSATARALQHPRDIQGCPVPSLGLGPALESRSSGRKPEGGWPRASPPPRVWLQLLPTKEFLKTQGAQPALARGCRACWAQLRPGNKRTH